MIRVQLHNPKREGTWALRWRSADGGRRYSETIGKADGPGRLSRAKAERIRRQKELDLNKGEIPRDRPRKMNLSDFAQWHAEIVAAEVRDTTAAEYGYAFQWAERIIGGGVSLSSVTSIHAARIRNGMSEQGKSAATIRKTLTHLRGAFSRAVKHRLITSNPFAGMTGKATEGKASRIFTPAEIESLAAAAPDTWWRAFILLGFTSGLRRDELLMLRWSDVDFDAATVTVRPHRAEAVNIDGVEVRTLEWKSKSKASYRAVPIPERTVNALTTLLESSDGSPYLFLSVSRLRTIAATMERGTWKAHSVLVNNLLRNFRTVQRAALGDKARLGSVHDMRKTFGTLTAQAVPMHVLKDLLGHSSITTTATFYTKVQASDADKVRELWTPKDAGQPTA